MRLTQGNKKQIQIADKAILKLNEITDLQIMKRVSMEQLKKALQKKATRLISVEELLSIISKNVIKVKISDIGRDYSLSAIENRLNINNELNLNPQLERKQTYRKQKGLGYKKSQGKWLFSQRHILAHAAEIESRNDYLV